MNEQLRLKELLEQIKAVRDTMHVIYDDSENSNVKFYVRNAFDYSVGLYEEIKAALEAALEAAEM